MTLLTCAAVRRRLPAFYDRELPIPDLIAIESHVSGCPPCSGELRELRELSSIEIALLTRAEGAAGWEVGESTLGAGAAAADRAMPENQSRRWDSPAGGARNDRCGW